MNSLSNLGKQLSELINSLNPSARIIAGLMVVVIVVSLGWIISSEVGGNYESLLGGMTLSNADMDRIETAFGDAQLRDYHREGKQIRIPKGQKDQYLKALSSAKALPKESGSEIDRALQEGSAFESSEKFAARMQTGEQRELANTLKRMPGIEFAAVHYDEQRKGFGRETERVCSIQLQGPHNQPIPDATRRRIAEHISKHFAGLPLTNISVLDLGTSNVFNQNDDPRPASENPVLAARQQWESYLDGKIGAVLTEYGAVILNVGVEIDSTLVQGQEKLSYDPMAATPQGIESRMDLEITKATSSGPPGSDANGIGMKPQRIESITARQSSKDRVSTANEHRVEGHDVSRRETAGLIPTKVAVTIGVPESHYRRVYCHRYLTNNPEAKVKDIPAPTSQQLSELELEIESTIRSAVETVAMGVRDCDDRKPLVTVYAYTDLTTPEFPEPSLASSTMVWLGQSWSTLALLALVLVSLGMMFGWIKSQADNDGNRKFAKAFGLEVPENMGDQLDIGDDEQRVAGDRLRSKPEFDLSEGEIKDDLSTLIKQNPDAVVNLLKSWMGDAA